MPNWGQVLKEINSNNNPLALDLVREKYLSELNKHTNRNVICYYSGWLQKPGKQGSSITDDDKNGFMNAIYGLDRSKGLDIILHTEGGSVAAVESLIHYLHQMFGNDIRAIIPQIAMSAGTMLACSCKEIIMGKHSNLGPIDPQLNGLAASSVIEEFEKAVLDIKADPARIPLWQTIIGKYHPTFLQECEHSIEWAEEIATQWLTNCMFEFDTEKDTKVKRIVEFLGNHSSQKSHGRHIEVDTCENIGLKIVRLEDDPILQDLVLTVHHCYMHAFSISTALKYIENHQGGRVIRQIVLPQQPPI